MRLVATWTRWAAGVAAVGLAFVAAVQGFVLITRSDRTLASFAWLIVSFMVVEAVLVLAILRAEEARLARELRTARTGTSVLRGMVARRRQQTPLLTRLFSTKLGAAAVLLQDGDREAALDAMAVGSALMRGGRLDALRAMLDADAERATGTSVGLERCVQHLRAMEPLGNREADLYRTHVLVKALLQQGDPEGALELARALEASGDEEEHIYAAWLRVWFDLEAGDEGADDGQWRPLGEGELRRATLLARAHGAEELVTRLEERIGSVARPARQ
jgi:hypothetical protein